MPKFARPNSYTGKQGNQQWTGDVRFATLGETLAAASTQLAISPATLAAAATGFVPAATTLVAGKTFLATNAQAVTGTLTDNHAINPASLTARLAAPGAIGGTTPAAGTFTAVNATSIGGTTPGTGAFTTLASTGNSNIASGAGNTAQLGNATGTVGFFGSAGATQVSQAALTNNVTAGGSAATIADFTDLTVYANDSAAIRNDIYQLALALANVISAMRSYGLLA